MNKIILCLFLMLIATKDFAQYGSKTGHEAIDLGLSVKWASCNVGANSPEQSGTPYAWSDVTGQINPMDNLTYPSSIVPFSIRGDKRYDVACAQWGQDWRLPTKYEFEELKERCSWEWTIYNNVKGVKVTGPNGNSIFLPLAGYRFQSTYVNFRDSKGCYWGDGSVMDPATGRVATYLYFSSWNGKIDEIGIFDGNCICGYYVRPVTYL